MLSRNLSPFPALPYLQKSLAIFQRIGSPHAATVQAILTRIQADAASA
ncbi:hypothetical protein [Leptolyngbya sp. PCC 6406]|nr:hypothetical protein [Leptolyngbya sp. PCC 6406]